MESERDPRATHAPTQDEIRTAHQIHTLAHMLYGRLAMTNPWVATAQTRPYATGGFTQTPWTHSWPVQAGFEPGAAARPAPWVHAWTPQPTPVPHVPFAGAPWMHGWPTPMPMTTAFPAAAGPGRVPYGYPMWGYPYGYVV